jgi:hypothetical protein
MAAPVAILAKPEDHRGILKCLSSRIVIPSPSYLFRNGFEQGSRSLPI